MLEHILEIIAMLLGAAILGFFIGWFLRNNKISKLEGYITSLEEKSNRLQSELNENERNLIDCQTEKKKLESDKQKIENLLIECQGNLVIPGIEKVKEEKVETKKSLKKKATSKKPKDKVKADNLTKIEGIGPKLAGILKDAGIETFKDLSKEKPGKISDILVKAGGNTYKRFDPTTWPDQAKLADDGKWDELNKWQEELKGGR